MDDYKELLSTRSDSLVTLLKFLMAANDINYIIENEHVVHYSPGRKMSVKIDQDKFHAAKELVEDLPRRMQEVKIV